MKRLRALIILAGFCAACGGSPSAEQLDTTESAATFVGTTVANGAYYCGGWWFIEQPIKQRRLRPIDLAPYFVTDVGAVLGPPPAGQPVDPQRNKVMLTCGSMDLKASAACGANAPYCNTAALPTTCQMYAKLAGASAWTFSGWIDVESRTALYDPNATSGPNGAWGMNLHYHYVPSQQGNGRGLSGCGAWGQTPAYLFYVFN
jgi:hypothetical protein